MDEETKAERDKKAYPNWIVFFFSLAQREPLEKVVVAREIYPCKGRKYQSPVYNRLESVRVF